MSVGILARLGSLTQTKKKIRLWFRTGVANLQLPFFFNAFRSVLTNDLDTGGIYLNSIWFVYAKGLYIYAIIPGNCDNSN